MVTLTTIDLLIADDFALEPMSKEESRDVYQLFLERTGRASMIISSNRDTAEWQERGEISVGVVSVAIEDGVASWWRECPGAGVSGGGSAASSVGLSLGRYDSPSMTKSYAAFLNRSTALCASKPVVMSLARVATGRGGPMTLRKSRT